MFRQWLVLRAGALALLFACTPPSLADEVSDDGPDLARQAPSDEFSQPSVDPEAGNERPDAAAAPEPDDSTAPMPSNDDDALAPSSDGGADAQDAKSQKDGKKVAKDKEKDKKKDKKPAPSPYKVLFFDNDFSYLDDPDNKDFRLGDFLKRNKIGDTVIDAGGEYRLRHHHEVNLRGSNLTGLSDDFLLQRTRAYLDVHHSDWLRFYGELIDATSSGEEFPPRTIEENRFDALNLFGDVLLYEEGDDKLWFRAGRQEQAYGAERLISPLDWANTRRTFDGLKLFYRSENWNFDGFWLRPVPFGQHVNNDHNFDHPDQSQEFMGIYATYKGIKDHALDVFYIRYAEYDAPGSAANPVDFDLHTFGGRWLGKQDHWLGEIEGGLQLGEYGRQSQVAGYFTAGLGYEWVDLPWKPTLWAYHDWASGDDKPTDRRHGTFNQLFPLAHKYFGFADLVARQNIRDLNFLLTSQPTEKTKLLVWWHIFHLDDSRDALYNAAGAPIRSDPTGRAGTDVGQELDVTFQILITPRADLLLGYSHFYPGSFVLATNPAGVTGDVDFYYGQFSLKF